MSVNESSEPLKVLVYSDDRTTRARIRTALGRRVASDLPELELFDVATPEVVMRSLDEMSYDLLIFDGEAVPLGGTGLTHQVKNEIPNGPPVVLLIAREADAWLASWCRAESIVALPIDPLRLSQAVAQVLRQQRFNSERV